MSDTTIPPHDPTRGRWIPWVFVGGMLLVVVVNAIMVYFALSTFTGVTVGRSYDRGRAYNQVIEEAARQDALGWQARVTLERSLLSVQVVDREGLPAIGRLEGVLVRPLERTSLPLDIAMVGPGRFIAAVEVPQPGQWEARLTLHGADGARFEMRERLFVQ